MKKVLAFVLFIGMAGQANATLFSAVNNDIYDNDLDPTTSSSFDYGGFTWDTGFSSVPNDPDTGLPNNDGVIATDGNQAFGDVQIFSSDTGAGVDLDGDGLADINTSSNMTTDITESGIITVTWDYFTFDDLTSFDPFVWLLDGAATTITDDALAVGCDIDGIAGDDGLCQSATTDFEVVAGTVFGFALLSDNLFGGGLYVADVVLSDLSFTAFGGNPVPVPPAFLLFGTALAGLGFFRKKKAAA